MKNSSENSLKYGRIGLRSEESERIVMALRELSLSYEETAELMKGVTKDAKSLRPLWGKPRAES